MSTASRRRSYGWGHVAEYLCLALLVCKGYSVLARRMRNHKGEIDIVAVRGKVISFIEVKARGRMEDALLSVTPAKRQRLMEAASLFLASRKKYADHGLRFDVMVVTSWHNIHHFKDAWRAS